MAATVVEERIEKLEEVIAKLRRGLSIGCPLDFPIVECPRYQTCYDLTVINELEHIVDDLRREVKK